MSGRDLSHSVACYLYRDDYDVILTVRPGITGYTQLAFAKGGIEILDPRDPERHYLTGLLPQKVALDRLYASRPSVRRDLWILVATILTVVFRRALAVDRTTGALTLRRRGPAVESTLPVQAVAPISELPIVHLAVGDARDSDVAVEGSWRALRHHVGSSDLARPVRGPKEQ